MSDSYRTFRVALATTAVLLALVAGTAAAFVYTGFIDPAADAPHSRPVTWLLDSLRTRGVAWRARNVLVPALEDPALITAGAGNYEAMCAGCHLKPGVADGELYRGLYPQPPALAAAGHAIPPAEAFWVITHGIKASGMPAWGRSMDERSIWGLVAFLQKLPELSPEAYREAVERSAGHSHGHGDTLESAMGAAEMKPAAVGKRSAAAKHSLHEHEHEHAE